MAKFSSDRFPPGFFDLPRDAGEALPLDIIEQWTKSSQSREFAKDLLAPLTLRGVVVSSDAAGLTRLTRERSLVEILALVNRPKELVHAYGAAVGGRAIGVWAADNSQMYYPEDVGSDRVVSMLLTLQDHVARECEVQIGLGAHRGAFFELGAGVYGADADRVESVAEEHTEGGELVITDTVAAGLSDTDFSLTPRPDLPARFGTILRVTGGPRMTGLQPTDFRYPLPFSDDFYEGLGAYARTGRQSVVPKSAAREAAVVLIEREREDPDIPEVAVLNNLALTAATKRIGATLLKDLSGAEIKSAGLIAIYTFPEPAGAVDFAMAYRRTLGEQGIQCRIGVDVGHVMIFELGGGRDIAGSPVNVASKLAQDCGELGKIYLSEEAARRASPAPEGERLRFEVSGVELVACVL